MTTNNNLIADVNPNKCSGILKKLPLFHGLQRSDFDALSHAFKATQIDAGQTIFREQDHSRHLYVLLAGEVELSRAKAGVIYRLLPGELFGEIGMVSQRLRTATATAAKVSTLLVISREDFNAILGKNPRVASILMRNITIALSSHLIRMNDKVLEYAIDYEEAKTITED